MNKHARLIASALVVMVISIVGTVSLLISVDGKKIKTTADEPLSGIIVELFLVPRDASASISQPSKLDLTIDSSGKRVSGLVMALSFDPVMIGNLNFIPSQTIKDKPAVVVDQTAGTMSIRLDFDTPVSTLMTLGELTFTPQKAGTTAIDFVEDPASFIDVGSRQEAPRTGGTTIVIH